MKKFIIERELPGAGNLSQSELQEISNTSCNVVDRLKNPYHWIQTFVTDDKMYCVHIAQSEEAIRAHSTNAGFPVKSIKEVKSIIDPTTASR